MEQELARLPYVPLTESMARAASTILSSCLSEAPADSFYGLALCPDNGVNSFYWMANSEEALLRKAERWLAETSRKFPEHEYSLDLAIKLFRFRVPDWAMNECWLLRSGHDHSGVEKAYRRALDALGAIWEGFGKIAPADDDDVWMELAERVRQRCLDALVEGLQRFDSSFGWQPRIDRSRFTILIFDPDPDDPEEVLRLARRLNRAESFEAFSANFHFR